MRKPIRIICVGDRFSPGDLAGPLVYDHLTAMDLPAGIEAIDGGWNPADLCRLASGARRVIFVEALDQVSRRLRRAGLPPFRKVAWTAEPSRRVSDVTADKDDLPAEVHLVVVDGFPCRQSVAEAAFLSLEMAACGRHAKPLQHQH